MNAATILGTLLSLLLAAATAGNRSGVNGPADRPAPPGHNLNHNETFVRDDIDNPTLTLSSWLTREHASLIAPVLMHLSYSGLTCSPWVCGSNHNETLLRKAR